jgi:hypothetical protein
MFTKIIAAAAYAAMLAVNFLANGLPINNRTTGAVSEAYPNLFTPAGITFSIWGLIYLLLGGYVVYQFTKGGRQKEKLLKKINLFFIATSLANISWILAWHYDFIGFSVLIMAALLALLIKIADILRPEQLALKEKLLISIPFSVYFGWITVAAIANITVFLVSIGWDGFGIADFAWTSIILLAGALIGILRMRKDRNTAYGLVLIWAYSGILFKHLSVDGFGGRYPAVIAAAITCLALFVFFTARIFYKK